VGEDAILEHDAHRDDPSLAFALSRLSSAPTGPTPIGIFRSVRRSVSGRELGRQLADARQTVGEGDLDALLRSGDTWSVA
jgi:2-oxoglutarate ferredoxin oxidoreductase subunit beta